MIFVRCVGRRAAGRADGTDQHNEKLQRARHLPAAQISRSGIAPDVGRKGRTGFADFTRDLDDHFRIDAGFLGGEFGRVLRRRSL